MTKRQKIKYLENEKSFYGEMNSIFHHFKGLSVAKNRLRHECTLKNTSGNFFYQWQIYMESDKTLER